MIKQTGKIVLFLLLIITWSHLFTQSETSNKSEKTIMMFLNESHYPEIELVLGVRDRQTGEGVYGLKKPDFTIKENDKNQVITSFLATEKGKFDAIDIIFLFDQTGSMGDEVTAVKNNSLLFADILEKSDIDYRLATITFSDKIESKFDFTPDINIFKDQVASIKVGGGGDVPENALEALKQASELELRPNARAAFILITDAPFHEKNKVTELVMRPLVKRLALRDIQVYPIAIPLDKYLWAAKETNGAYFNIIDDFSAIIEELAYGLTSQYKLRYITSNPCPDGSEVDVGLLISKIEASALEAYKRPLNFNQLDLNFEFASKDILSDPQKPIECDLLSFLASIQATSCSDSAIMKNIIVKLYDVNPGERTELARSEPFDLQSNGQARRVKLEWNTSGFRGDRQLEFVIDPGKKLEKSKEDNIISKKINISEVAHDLYIESIEYTPNPVEPCDVVRVSVKANDGTRCQGLILHDIELEAFDGKKSIGKLVTSIKVGEPEPVVFEWDAEGNQKPKRLKFIVDPDCKFGKELTRKNNVKEVLIDIKPARHDLFPVSVTHSPRRPIVGDKVLLQVKVEDKGHCPEVPLEQNILVRLSDAENRFKLAESKPFTINTQSIKIIPIEWKTRLKDHGSRELAITVDPQQKIRELTPPGKENNTIKYPLEIRPMPHDLIIKSVVCNPKIPIDGDPAVLKVKVEDNARFPGVKLENVKLKAFERYSRVLLGLSEPNEIFSRQTAEIKVPIDTGGMAGEREILVVVDHDNEIEELTPDDLDGENNNEFIFRINIQEGS